MLLVLKQNYWRKDIVMTIKTWYISDIYLMHMWYFVFPSLRAGMIRIIEVGLILLCCWFHTKGDFLIYEHSLRLWSNSLEISFYYSEHIDLLAGLLTSYYYHSLITILGSDLSLVSLIWYICLMWFSVPAIRVAVALLNLDKEHQIFILILFCYLSLKLTHFYTKTAQICV